MTDWETKAQEYVDKHAPAGPHYVRLLVYTAYLSGADDGLKEGLQKPEPAALIELTPIMVAAEDSS